MQNKEYKREWQRRWRLEHPTEQRILSKKYTENKKLKDPVIYKKKISEAVRKWRLKNPERNKAHRAVFTALRNGSLKKEFCFCGEKKVEAHHENYSKPLEVEWLCKIHHTIADKKRRTS